MRKNLALIFWAVLISACSNSQKPVEKTASTPLAGAVTCTSSLPNRFAVGADTTSTRKSSTSTKGMVWIPAQNGLAGFYMDATEVTNAQFAEFVKDTKYKTTAEIQPVWEELKKQLPPGTAKPADSLLVPASLVFSSPSKPVNLNNPGGWWIWKKGANWQHPNGPGSSVKGRENYPVVHLSWDDAMAYCKWAGKRLPSAAEWETAARGGFKDAKYPWGNEDIDQGKPKANTWQGDFPYRNTQKDGFERLAEVKSFSPNKYGLYDMAGNVWEWCSDDSEGEKLVKGGSFLCNASYCEGYKIDTHMTSSRDTGLEHTGFRCVK